MWTDQWGSVDECVEKTGQVDGLEEASAVRSGGHVGGGSGRRVGGVGTRCAEKCFFVREVEDWW